MHSSGKETDSDFKNLLFLEYLEPFLYQMWSILTGEDAIGYGPKWFGYRNDIPAKFSIAKIVLYTVAVITFLALILGE